MPLLASPLAQSVATLDAGRGTYLLLLYLAQRADLPIGRMGVQPFQPGWYLYVGSAFGSGGVRGRVRHHLAPVRRPHWHIDYLRAAAGVEEIWYRFGGLSLEHRWATELGMQAGVQIPAARFGASDCRCAAHLFYSAQRPATEMLGRLVDGDGGE